MSFFHFFTGSRYSDLSSATNNDTETTRSRVLQFDSESCIFCQLKNKDELHSVSTAEVGKKLLMFKEGSNDELKVRLSCMMDPLDAVAYEVKYHKACKRREERRTITDVSESEEQKAESTSKVIAD